MSDFDRSMQGTPSPDEPVARGTHRPGPGGRMKPRSRGKKSKHGSGQRKRRTGHFMGKRAY